MRNRVSRRNVCLAVINGRNVQNSATWSQFVEWLVGVCGVGGGTNRLPRAVLVERGLAACFWESKLAELLELSKLSGLKSNVFGSQMFRIVTENAMLYVSTQKHGFKVAPMLAES